MGCDLIDIVGRNSTVFRGIDDERRYSKAQGRQNMSPPLFGIVVSAHLSPIASGWVNIKNMRAT
jgi:hypothetical protein